MNRLPIYLILLLVVLLVSCTGDEPATSSTDETPQTADDAGLMIFMPRAATLSRASSNGLYTREYYPVNKLFLTAYHRDNLGKTQWYFKDIQLQACDSTNQKLDYNDSFLDVNGNDKRLWKANGWYWPIQGKMEFLSYWSPKVYGTPEFYEYEHADGTMSAQMVVNAQGVDNGEERYEGLDGYTDFLYIAENNIPCPQGRPLGLTYKHGLAWLTLTLEATVPQYDTNGVAIPNSIDIDKTNELIDKVKVQKIVIEDLSRKGTAYLVPGLPVAWTINKTDIKDQVYTRPDTATTVRGNYAYFKWKEVDDGRSYTAPDYVTLSATKQYLGLYRPQMYDSIPNKYQPETDPDTEYVGNGLLVIPQHKTAITVYFLIKNGKVVLDQDGNEVTDAAGNPLRVDLEVAEKFELRDNDVEWEPGMRYQYDIVFTSAVSELEDKFEVKVVESTYEILIDPVTTCYDYDAFGQIVTTTPSGTVTTPFKTATFVLDPMHNEGSPFSDEMDYFDGGRIF